MVIKFPFPDVVSYFFRFSCCFASLEPLSGSSEYEISTEIFVAIPSFILLFNATRASLSRRAAICNIISGSCNYSVQEMAGVEFIFHIKLFGDHGFIRCGLVSGATFYLCGQN